MGAHEMKFHQFSKGRSESCGLFHHPCFSLGGLYILLHINWQFVFRSGASHSGVRSLITHPLIMYVASIFSESVVCHVTLFYGIFCHTQMLNYEVKCANFPLYRAAHISNSLSISICNPQSQLD